MVRRRGRKKQVPVPETRQAVDKFRFEVAAELGSDPEYPGKFWGNTTFRQSDAEGGELVRHRIALAEQELHRGRGGFKND